MTNKTIKITDSDKEHLEEVLKAAAVAGQNCAPLEKELQRAKVVASDKIPADVVTMNSKVRVRDLDTNEEMVLQIVSPGEANPDEGTISILAPVGTALIGYKVGDTIKWQVPAGTRRLRIEEMLYQPEETGDINL